MTMAICGYSAWANLRQSLHLHKRKVRAEQSVRQRQLIGTVGATGYATGPHLHYGFLVNGVHRNPRTVALPKAKQIPKSERKSFSVPQMSCRSAFRRQQAPATGLKSWQFNRCQLSSPVNDATVYIGLMSGTSLDAVDAVAVRFEPSFDLIGSYSQPMPEHLRTDILELCEINRAA